MTILTIKEQRDAVIETLERRGWRQWSAQDQESPCCLLNACGDAGAGDIVYKLRMAVEERGYQSVAQWNDAPGRTFDEVKELLRSIA
jgi:hypothetical protein